MRRLLLCLTTFSCAWAGDPPVSKPVPGLYLASVPAAPIYGDTVTIGALVMGPYGAPVPTGSVVLYMDTTQNTIALDDSGHGSVVSPLPAKTYMISGVYGGDSHYLSAISRLLTVTVAKAGTIVTLGTPAAQVVQPVTLTATLTLQNWAAAPIFGTVRFTNNGAAISGCTAVEVQRGPVTCTARFSQTGTFTI